MTTPTGLGFSVELQASIDSLSGEMAMARHRATRLNQMITLARVPGIPVQLSGGDGTLQLPNILGPMTGQWWDIRRIAVWGFTAGTVNAYLSSPSGDLVLSWAAAGVTTLGKAHVLLRPNDSLVFVATGVTGSVTVALDAIQVEAPVIGDYLL